MRDENKATRRAQIAQAAYALLEEKGYAGTSMLGIARRSRASNETLYNWYGDKTGLFQELVRNNAAEVRALLEQHLSGTKTDPLKTLRDIGPVLLDVLLGPRAVALNRAAAADATGALGAVISAQGRETISPLIGQVLLDAREKGQLSFTSVSNTLELYLNLLVGDLQIRRVIGQVAQPTSEEQLHRAELALARLQVLLRPSCRHVGLSSRLHAGSRKMRGTLNSTFSSAVTTVSTVVS